LQPGEICIVMTHPETIDRLLAPRSIAVIGASNSPASAGYSLVANLIRLGYRGEVYAVNPRSDEVQGLPAYASIRDCPRQGIDLAVIAVRTPMVPDVLEQCGEAGVGTALIVSDGFADGGEDGKELQRQVVDIARRHQIRVVGPNTQGFYNAERNLLVMTGSAVPKESMKKEGVSIAAQTGLFLGGWLIRGMTAEGMGMNKSIDLGNMCDIDHTDMLGYLGADPSTEVIVMHMDRLDRAGSFMRTARAIAPRKPVVVVKLGASPAAREAIFSHTGSLAGDDSAFDALCAQSGVARASDFDEVEDLSRTFLHLAPLRGKRIGVINFSGATGIIACDACARFGLEVGPLSQASIDAVAATLPAWASVSNPVDFMQSFEVDMRKTLTVALEALLADPRVDGILLIVVTMASPPIDAYLNIVRELADGGLTKPVAVWALGDEGSSREIQALSRKGVVAYPSITRAVRALAASYRRQQYLVSVEAGH